MRVLPHAIHACFELNNAFIAVTSTARTETRSSATSRRLLSLALVARQAHVPHRYRRDKYPDVVPEKVAHPLLALIATIFL